MVEIKKGSRVECTHPKTGKVMYGIVKSIRGTALTMVLDDGVNNFKWDIRYFRLSSHPLGESKIKTFKFRAVIHPKTSGDDYVITSTVKCIDEREARETYENYLSKKSAVIDYTLI